MRRIIETGRPADSLAPRSADQMVEPDLAATPTRRRRRLRGLLRRSRSVQRRDPASRRRRRRVVLAVLLVVSLFLPVPWIHVMGENPLGIAWRLDGHLEVEGEVIDPPGRWSWLTVGRPKLVYEVIRDTATGRVDPYAEDLRDAGANLRPSLVEPTAAAVGLNRAGRSIALGVLVQASRPTDERYPDDATIVAIDGVPLQDRATIATVASNAIAAIGFETADGRSFVAPGPRLPYERIRIIDLAPEEFDAAIYGRLPDVWPITWFRGLALGNSHGLMVALTTYAHAAGHDLAQGRHIAGTGGIRGDGTVTRIGGLPSKARAARDNGADVMLYPAQQGEDLVGFDAGRMKLVPVTTLNEAIAWLEQPAS